jgi:hypothetical protein
MKKRLRFMRGWLRRRRARRWMKEIMLAIALTVAAAGFIAVALLRGEQAPGDPHLMTARKAPSQ